MEKSPTPTTATNESLLYDALTRQLERMRGMQAAYFGRFFWWVALTLGAMIFLVLSSSYWGTALLPFLAITAGVQASFYLYYVDFARSYAEALERRLNRLLGEEALIASRLEDGYFYELDAPRLSGFSYDRPWGFFSAYTLHWCVVWALFYIFGLRYMILLLIDEAQTGLLDAEGIVTYTLYFVVLVLWTAANIAYLARLFYRRKELSAMRETLRRIYGSKTPEKK